jgi:hypothetical protein
MKNTAPLMTTNSTVNVTFLSVLVVVRNVNPGGAP